MEKLFRISTHAATATYTQCVSWDSSQFCLHYPDIKATEEVRFQGLVYMSEKVTFLLKVFTFLVIYLPHLNFPPFLNEGVSTGRTEF